MAHIFNQIAMPTTKTRTNITLDEELDRQLNLLAARDDVPKATKVVQLIRIAIDIEEDDYFNELATKRDTKNAKFISHNKAWK